MYQSNTIWIKRDIRESLAQGLHVCSKDIMCIIIIIIITFIMKVNLPCLLFTNAGRQKYLLCIVFGKGYTVLIRMIKTVCKVGDIVKWILNWLSDNFTCCFILHLNRFCKLFFCVSNQSSPYKRRYIKTFTFISEYTKFLLSFVFRLFKMELLRNFG